jgi:hypothetical protein
MSILSSKDRFVELGELWDLLKAYILATMVEIIAFGVLGN